MRQLGKQERTKDVNEIFKGMMNNIQSLVDIVHEQTLNVEKTYDENIYNYVMKNENGLVKIGISCDVDCRQNTLEHASGYKIADVFFIKPKKKASLVENELHKFFKKQRKLGEWFYISFDEAVKKTKELADKEWECPADKNETKDEKIINSLSMLGLLGQNDEDILDYYVISLALKKDDSKAIVALIDIYAKKYIESGEEVYNLLTLFLLLKLEEKYNISIAELENGDQYYRFGHTAFFYEKEIDFGECLDWFHSIYEVKHK